MSMTRRMMYACPDMVGAVGEEAAEQSSCGGGDLAG